MGAQRNAAARGGDCAGVGRTRRKGDGVPRRAGRGRFSPGRRGQGAVSGDAAAASGARRAGAFLPGGGGKPGAGGLGRVRRTKTAWRARRRWAGVLPGGEARAVYGGFPGRTRGRRGGQRGGKAGAAPRCRGAAGGSAGKTAAPSAACVGFQATSAIEAAGGRKSPFLPYKEALFPGARLLSNQSCFAPESLSLRSGCFFGGVE